MFDKWFNLPAHHYLAITGLCIIAVGLTLSNVMMSVGTIWIISNVVIEAKYQAAWNRIKNNRWFIWSAAIFSLHIIWLIGTENFEYAFHDIKIKLPFIVIPLALAARPRNTEKEIHWILSFFLGAVVITSLYNYAYFYNIIPNNDQFDDIRAMSLFVSHIRYSFMVVFAFFICIYLIIKKVGSVLLIFPVSLWLLYYATVSQIMSGFIVLVIILVLGTIYTAFYVDKKWLKRTAWVLGISLILGAGYIISEIVSWNQSQNQNKKVELLKTSRQGNHYSHKKDLGIRENGHLVYVNFIPQELKRSWNRHSEISYDSLNAKGYPIKSSLLHYMASKGLVKDSVGFSQLKKDDIKAIEQGFSNHLMTKNDIRSKIFVIWKDWQQLSLRDPNGSSVLQRFYHLTTAWSIVKDHWFLGIGTGDVQDVFYEYYKKQNTPLKKENQNRAHNQVLTFWLTFGITGLILFLLYMTLPLFYFKKEANFLVPIFVLMAFLTFMMEDMLETQAGVTFFSFFFNLLLIRKRDPK